MDSRFDVTTEHLRDAATEMLLERGIRAFSLNALAKAAFVSIGSVYERWTYASAAVDDVLRTRALPALHALFEQIPAGDDPFVALLEDARGVRAVRLAVEALFAARDDPNARPHAQTVVNQLKELLARGARPVDEACRPYAVVVCVGLGLLRTGECAVPEMASTLGTLLEGAGNGSAPVRARARVLEGRPDLHPPLGEVSMDDDTGRALRASTRRLLESTDERATTARTIASETGVTTGALYRRFPSRSDLLVDVLMGELQGHRYAWTTALLSALQSDDPITAGAHVLAEALTNAVADSPTNRMLLEITVSARSDDTVRRKLVSQIEAVAQSRVSVFEHLAQAGLIDPGLDSSALAWLLQAAPIGGRLMCAAGVLPDIDHLELGIRRVTERALLVPREG